MPSDARTIADDYPLPTRKVRWLGLVFFLILHVVGIVGTPLYIYYYGITLPASALFFVYLTGDIAPSQHQALKSMEAAVRSDGGKGSDSPETGVPLSATVAWPKQKKLASDEALCLPTLTV